MIVFFFLIFLLGKKEANRNLGRLWEPIARISESPVFGSRIWEEIMDKFKVAEVCGIADLEDHLVGLRELTKNILNDYLALLNACDELVGDSPTDFVRNYCFMLVGLIDIFRRQEQFVWGWEHNYNTIKDEMSRTAEGRAFFEYLDRHVLNHTKTTNPN